MLFASDDIRGRTGLFRALQPRQTWYPRLWQSGLSSKVRGAGALFLGITYTSMKSTIDKPLIVVAVVIGMVCQWTWSSATRTAVGSNRFALEESLNEGLRAYHLRHGVYPDSLDDVHVDWLKDPDRRMFLLRSFYYENRGTSYLLWWPRHFDVMD